MEGDIPERRCNGQTGPRRRRSGGARVHDVADPEPPQRHRGADADLAELAGVAAELGAAGRGVLQLVADFLDVDTGLKVILEMARASGRPVSVSLAQFHLRPGAYREVLSRLAAATVAPWSTW